MTTHLRPALVLFLLFTVLTGLAYPLGMTGLGQMLFPSQAHGSLITQDGKVIGSALIGQTFTSENYFHGRPSATTGDDSKPAPYNAANSMGSNAGPTAKGLVERVQAEAVKLKAENPDAVVPVDLATASASGVDPHVSPAAALFQVPRVARARGLTDEAVRSLVMEHTQGRSLGLLGEPVVNVLQLNLALDRLQKS